MRQVALVAPDFSGCTAAIVSQANTAAIPGGQETVIRLINISMADPVACLCETLSHCQLKLENCCSCCPPNSKMVK